MATPCVKLLGHQCFTMLCVFLSFCNSLDQPSIWNFTVIEGRIRCITKEHISMHGIDPTCGCIHSIIVKMLFRFSRLFRQVYVQITPLCMDSFWFLGHIICKLWSENLSAAALTASTFPAVWPFEVIQIAFFAVLVHHYISRVLTDRKIVFRKGPVSLRPSLKMYSKSILIRCFNKRFNNEGAMTSPVHYHE